MIPVDARTMLEIAPRFSGELAQHQAAICTAVGEVLSATLAQFQIDSRLRIAHFLGQTCHESAGFRTTEEFATGQAYEGREDLGNTQPGDGVRFKGRGLIQLTGRANYRTYGKALKLDLENHPEQAAEPRTSLVIACQFWTANNLNALADQDDVIRVTQAINGGQNGIADRRDLTSKAKDALARILALVTTGGQPNGTHPVLHRGSTGDAVVELQRCLRALGFAVAVDGSFGPGTEVAVMSVQSTNKLTADGVVGAQTWAVLAPPAK